MPPPARAPRARLVLVERRDTVAARDPSAARVRRYRLARTQITSAPTSARAVAPRSLSRSYAPPPPPAPPPGGARLRPPPARAPEPAVPATRGAYSGLMEEKTGTSFGMRI